MPTGFVWDERYMWHDPGNGTLDQTSGGWIEPGTFAENPESKRRMRNLIEASGLLDELAMIKPRPATPAEIERVHAPDYVARIRDLSAGFGGDAGESTPFHTGSYEIALLAAGGVISAVDAVIDGAVDNAYALVRPPGHHAERARGRGFCIFGNCAIAARHALAARGLTRVAIIDWDVHHGNGTQDAFYDDRRALTVSIHAENQYPPGRGSPTENGAGNGVGTAINVPLPHGSGVGAYLYAFDQVVVPALRAYSPELILVASGLDASALDPLGRMLLHSDAYREMTQLMLDVAGELSSGRLVLSHEGGYSPGYAPFCGLAIVETLSGMRTAVEDPFLGALRDFSGQDLQSHQRTAVDIAAGLITRIPSV
jgi:acetoin utilization deacetylase AcuC-like enzyme